MVNFLRPNSYLTVLICWGLSSFIRSPTPYILQPILSRKLLGLSIASYNSFPIPNIVESTPALTTVSLTFSTNIVLAELSITEFAADFALSSPL